MNDLEREKESEHVIDETEDEEYPLVNVEYESDNGIELDKNIDYNLCKITTQHNCVACNKPVCNLFCSIADPNSSNEMTRRHKDNDPRCVVPSTLLEEVHEKSFVSCDACGGNFMSNSATN